MNHADAFATYAQRPFLIICEWVEESSLPKAGLCKQNEGLPFLPLTVFQKSDPRKAKRDFPCHSSRLQDIMKQPYRDKRF